MIEIPAGTRVYGIQLPIQSKSKTFVADWELTATPADLARVAQTADEHGFFYVRGVRPHRDPRIAREHDGHVLAGLHLHALVVGRPHRAHQPPLAHLRAPLPSPADRGQGVRDPRLPLGRPRHRRHRRRSRRGGVRGPRRRPRARGKLVEEKLPPLIEALEHEFVDGLGRGRGRCSRRARRCGSRARARRRSAARRPTATAGCRKARRTRRWWPSCRHSTTSTAAPTGDDDRRHHAVPLRG